MPFWEFLGRQDRQEHHNLQDGLFQIATQTCSILVQVNNTNNISYGDNATNVLYNNLANDGGASTSYSCTTTNHRSGGKHNTDTRFDREQSIVLIPPNKHVAHGATATSDRGSRRSFFQHYKHRLSTVLENNTPASPGDDDFELWDQNQMLRSENEYKWGHGGWCKPSCIPIAIILTLIVLVVLLPLIEHNGKLPSKRTASTYICSDNCRIQLVESIPEGLAYPQGSPTFLSTYDAWNILLDSANETIDIGSFYWTLRGADFYNHSSAWQGEKIFQNILNAGTKRGIKVRIAQSAPTKDSPNIDTEIYVKRKAATVRSVNFPRLMNGGVLHTKLWIVDNLHMYVGSANMDWRSLTQVKELGVLLTNCSCLVNDIAKIFNVYWDMGKDDARIPPQWPIGYATKYNLTNPIVVNYNDEYKMNTFISSSPPPMSPKGRTQDIDAIVAVIKSAEHFVHISVMDYLPLIMYTPKIKYWPVIDDALRSAAIDNKVSVKLLISWWNHSRPAEDYFLRSLEALTDSYPGVDIQIRRFIVPATEDQLKIPFGRVNHNKYMVTDRVAYIGTSNWSGDYFTNTAGIGFVLEDTDDGSSSNTTTLRTELASIFERDWNSPYAVQLQRRRIFY